jgi:serine/threonine protein kinase
MHIVCSHCQNPIEMVGSPSVGAVCPSCGRNFQLEGGLITTRQADQNEPATGAYEPTPSFLDSEVATLPPKVQPEKVLGAKPRIPDYEILSELGRGGMGVVYKAHQISLNRTIALKLILAGRLASSEEVQRFHLEAEAAANLDHPNIIPIYEIGEFEEQSYFTMKFVEGSSLAKAMANGQWPGADQERLANGQVVVFDRQGQQRAAKLLVTVARAVHHAHQRGILHRDLKPANIMLDSDGEAHITDFGLPSALPALEGSSGKPSLNPEPLSEHPTTWGPSKRALPRC